MVDFPRLLEALVSHRVLFIVVGGVAAAAHGSVRLTLDLDLVYERSPDNVARLAQALSGGAPYLRGAPEGLPFRFDPPTILRGLNFTLTTQWGFVDLLGEICGGGAYCDLLPHTVEMRLFGHPCRVLDLATLIHVKRAAGRPKDLEAIAELEALRRELG